MKKIYLFLAFILLSPGCTRVIHRHTTKTIRITEQKQLETREIVSLSYDKKLEETIKASKELAVAIYSEEKNSSIHCGSGVVLHKNGLILTASHILPKNKHKKTMVIVDRKTTKKATLISKLEELDLAILKINHTFKKAAVFSEQDPKNDDFVFTVGYPGLFQNNYNDMPFISRGRYYLNKIQMDRVHKNRIIPTINSLYRLPVISGASGSPIFNKHGELIGIVRAVGRYPEEGYAFTYSLALDHFGTLRHTAKLLNRAKKSKIDFPKK